LRRFIPVYKNEVLKILMRKTAVFLLLIVTVLTIGIGFIKRSEFRFSDQEKEQIQQSSALTTLENSLKVRQRNLENYIANTVVKVLDQENELTSNVAVNLITYVWEYTEASSKVWAAETKIDKGVVLDTDFRGELIAKIAGIKARIDAYDYLKTYRDNYGYEQYPSAMAFYNTRIEIKDDAQKAELEAEIEKYNQIVTNVDFDAYCEYEINRMEEYIEAGLGIRDPGSGAPIYTPEEWKRQIEIVELRKTARVTGMLRSHKAFFSDAPNLLLLKSTLESYEQDTYATQSSIDEIKKKINMIEYYIEHQLYDYGKENTEFFTPQSSIGFAKGLMEIARILLCLVAIVLASTSVSRELETGSVKFLMVNPVKRHKVVLAKFCAIITVMLIALVWMALVVTVSTGIAAGFDALHPYLFVGTNGVFAVPFVVFTLMYLLVMILPIAWFTALGLQFSATIRNSVGSMFLCVVVLLLGVAVDILAYHLLYRFWLQFIPTVPLAQLSNALFPYGGVDAMIPGLTFDGAILTEELGILFALGYAVLLTAGMLWTAIDSFCHRDIK